MQAITRRDAFALTAGAIAAVPTSVFAGDSLNPAAPADDRWDNLATACREMSRDGDLVVSRARAHGLKFEDFAGIQVNGCDRNNRRLVLVFGDWQKSGSVVHHVAASGIGRTVT